MDNKKKPRKTTEYCNVENGLHIGKIVREYINKENIELKSLSMDMGYSFHTGIQNILRKPNWDVDSILKISIILRHNFFKSFEDFYKKSVPKSIFDKQHPEYTIIEQQAQKIINQETRIADLEKIVKLQSEQIELLQSPIRKK